MVELRPYQVDAVAEVRTALRGHRRVCFQLATGGGKTIVFGWIASQVAERGRRAIVLVHRRELVSQTVAKLRFFGVEAGVVAAGWPADLERPIQVASVQTLARRLEAVPPAELLVVDECHHAVAGSWRSVLEAYPDAHVLGVTATPERLDGKGLGDVFDVLVCGPSVAQLTRGGYLAEARLLSAAVPDLAGISLRGGDYAKGKLADAMSGSELVGNAVEHYGEHAAGIPAIAFCVTVDHAELVAERFRAVGYRAASVDGSMAKGERDHVIGGLAARELDVLASCELISEGLDVPDVGAAILLRPTRSLALYLQQVGRTLRPKPDGAPAIILDHAGNAGRHGHPAEHRLWSLEGRAARTRLLREWEAAEREDRERERAARQPFEVTGQLVEMSLGQVEAMQLRQMPLQQALRLCGNAADLRKLAQVRGYRPGWVWHVMQGRRDRGRGLRP